FSPAGGENLRRRLYTENPGGRSRLERRCGGAGHDLQFGALVRWDDSPEYGKHASGVLGVGGVLQLGDVLPEARLARLSLYDLYLSFNPAQNVFLFHHQLFVEL